MALAAVAAVLVARDLGASRPVTRTAVAVDSYRPTRPPTSPPAPATTAPTVAATTPPTTAAPAHAPVSAVAPTTAAPPPTDPPQTAPPHTAPPPPTTAPPPPATSPPATTAPAAAPAVTAAAPAGYGCAAALAYLAAHAAPGFRFECPGNALGHQAMTCSFVAGVCPGTRLIAIADPCPAAYMNEAYNSRVAEGLAPGPFDPYGYCRN